MKKLLLSIIASITLLFAMTFAVHAAGDGAISATSATGVRGDTVTVSVNLATNPGLTTLRIQVAYPAGITLQSVSNAGLLSGWTTPSPTISSPYTLRWADSLATENNTATGTIATLTFHIDSNATFGVNQISINVVESRDASGGKNNIAGTAATITVNCNHSFGAWTKVDDNTHSRVCSICSTPETANHTWNDGVVTNAATCKEAGEKTYTCTACGATKKDSIPKMEDHNFGAWTKVDDNTHKHVCSVCDKEETSSHTWNSGVVTKAATCKEAGEKTYTCTVCNTTKKDTIPKTDEHNYGAWTKVDDNTHKRVCTVCGKEETASHTWNGGVVTKQPTCKDKGEKTYTCTGCGHTRTEEIEKTTDHKFGEWTKKDANNHARTCSVCGKEETAAHDYSANWKSDASGHYHECSVCHDKKDSAAHTPGAAATETSPQTCTVCNYIITPALGHTHNWATTWTSDDSGHWYACSGCNEKGAFSAHAYDNACDPDCNVCGYTRTTEHDFELKHDETSHWQECKNCGEIKDKEDHVPGPEATDTTAQVCLVCDYEIEPAKNPEATESESEEESRDENETEESDGEKKSEEATEPGQNGNGGKSGKGGSPWPWILGAIAVVLAAIIPIVLISRGKKEKKEE